MKKVILSTVLLMASAGFAAEGTNSGRPHTPLSDTPTLECSLYTGIDDPVNRSHNVSTLFQIYGSVRSLSQGCVAGTVTGLDSIPDCQALFTDESSQKKFDSLTWVDKFGNKFEAKMRISLSDLHDFYLPIHGEISVYDKLGNLTLNTSATSFGSISVPVTDSGVLKMSRFQVDCSANAKLVDYGPGFYEPIGPQKARP